MAAAYEAMTPDQRGEALYQASVVGNLNIVNLLIDMETDINHIGGNRDFRQTPLFMAALKGHTAIVERLLAAGANKEAADSYRQTPLFVAAWKGHTHVVEILLAAGANKEATTIHQTTPLFVAARECHTAIVERLLAAGANMEAANVDQITPLYIAALKGHTAIVERLLAAGANKEAADSNRQTPLFVAAWKGHTHVVERLIAAGANKDAADNDRQTPLFIAAWKGHTHVVEILLAAGANMEAATVNQITPLYIAAREGHTAIVERLLAAGANKEAADSNRQTPLFVAAWKGHTHVVEILLAAGANKEATTIHQTTPLFVAARECHTAIVERLLAAGANKEAADKHGNTPLLIAALKGHKAIVERLLAAGADITKRNNEGKTAKQIAAEKGHVEIVKLLMPKWKGFSRDDIEMLNHVFDTEAPAGRRSDAENVSCCPVCFKYVDVRVSPQIVSRAAGCMYILDHNCSTLGGYYHKDLYNKYKNPDGTICWCTICGRICRRTPHAHYELALANGPKANVLPHLGDPFGGEADCIKDGGGGLMEKLARYRRMREIAAQLQKQIDKISFNEAIDALIEETWNAPLSRNFNLPNIAVSKTWNIPPDRFPIIRPNVALPPLALDAPWPFQGRPVMMPLIEPAVEGNTNAISMEDIAIAIQLRHRKANGEIVLHEKIGIHTLFGNDAYGVFSAAGTETFGRCFFEGCSAILYPGELQYILDHYNHPESLSAEKRAEYQTKINKYKERFNEAYKNIPEFKARVDADVAAAAAMPAGGAGAAAGGAGAAAGGAGQGGGMRSTRRFRRQQRRQSRHRKH